MSESTNCLYAVKSGKLLFYWADKAKPFAIPANKLKQFQLLNLHHRYAYALEDLAETHEIKEYTPLSYAMPPEKEEKTCDGFCTVTLNSQNTHSRAAIAGVINESTRGSLTAESIKAWTTNNAFAPELWIGAIDKKTNNLVGVGISTYFSSVMETDLDWFYVRRSYQGRGIGTMLVQETISRCRRKSHIIRVAGIAEDFYIKCGFARRDKWYYLTQKSAHAEWWD